MIEPTSTPASAFSSADDLALVNYLDFDALMRDAKVDQAGLSDALAGQTSLFIFYARNAVLARGQYERYKRLVEITEAALNNRWRQTLEKEAESLGTTDAKGVTKVRAVTEPMVRAAVLTDPAYKALTARLLKAHEYMKGADMGERSMETRKDMVLQLARDASKALDGPLRVALNQNAADAKANLLASMATRASA